MNESELVVISAFLGSFVAVFVYDALCFVLTQVSDWWSRRNG